GRAVSLGELNRDVAALAGALPRGGSVINLCEDRYHLLAAYAAALSAKRTSLLPPSRVEQVVCEVERANPTSCRVDDASVASALRHGAQATVEQILPSDFTAMIGYTSGSTGQPKANPKRW